MLIRKAIPGDEKSIARVCMECNRATFKDLFTPKYFNTHMKNVIDIKYSEEKIHHEIVNISREWNGWFVAEKYGQIIGATSGGFTSNQTAEVFDLYLLPDYHGHKIESLLLEKLTKVQHEMGASEQWLTTAKSNQHDISLLEECGFVFKEKGPSPHIDLNENSNILTFRYKRSI